MAKNDTPDTEIEDGDAPLIDLNDAQVKKMMARAEKRGTVTIDEINAAIPADQNEMIEDIMSRLSERGVNVVESRGARPPPPWPRAHAALCRTPCRAGPRRCGQGGRR
jgi:MoxR-like ATPase